MTTLTDELIQWPFATSAALAAALVGYAIWLRQQRSARVDRRVLLRQGAYREVWEALQRAEVRIRAAADTASPEPIQDLIRDVNATIMKHEFLLELDDRALATGYLEAAHRLATLLREKGTEIERSTFATTAANPSPEKEAFMHAMRDLTVARHNVLTRVSAAFSLGE